MMTDKRVVRLRPELPALPAPRIVLSYRPEPDARIYAVNRLISRQMVEDFYFPLQESGDKKALTLGDTGAALIHNLNKIFGITTVLIRRHSLFVRIAMAVHWQDGVHDGVIAALRECFGADTREAEISQVDERQLAEKWFAAAEPELANFRRF